MNDLSPRSARAWTWKPVIGSALLAAAIAATVLLDVKSGMEALLDLIGRLGVWGPVLFIAAYVAATVLMIPGSLLTLGAGAVFGLLRGFLYVSLASVLGATAAFLLARHFARSRVERRIEGSERFASLDEAVKREGWKIVGLTRLSPVFPFTVLNYAFGLTRVRLRDYMLASWIGMMPGTVTYVYLGSLAGAAARAEGRTPVEWTLHGVGLAATIAVTLYVTGLARKALAKRADLPAVDSISP